MPYPLYYTDGKVGIGKPNPEVELDVNGTIKADGFDIDGGDISVSELTLKKEGVVGNATDPVFTESINNAGINEPEITTFYSDATHPTPRKIAGLESTGTFATVRETRGSHFEGFSPDGVYYATFRMNTYPEGQCHLEMGPGGCEALTGKMVRTSNVVAVETNWPHGFGNGQTITLASPTNMSAGVAVAAGDYTCSYVDPTHFTIPQVGTDASSLQPGFWSASPDTAVARVGWNQLSFKVGGASKFSIYPDSFTTEFGVRFVTAGTLEANQVNSTSTTPYTMGLEFGLLVDSTAGAKVVNLPAASGCKGRIYCIQNTTGTNTVTVTPNGADTINGAATLPLSGARRGVLLVSMGSGGWVTFNPLTPEGFRGPGNLGGIELDTTEIYVRSPNNGGEVHFTNAAGTEFGKFNNAGLTFGNAARGITLAFSDSSGTPGNATINRGSGRSAIALAGTACTITNSMCVGASSVVHVTPEDADATLIRFRVTVADGSFTVTGNAAATAAWKFRWTVFNPPAP